MWSENGGYRRGRPEKGCRYHGRQAEVTQMAQKQLRLLDYSALTATFTVWYHPEKATDTGLPRSLLSNYGWLNTNSTVAWYMDINRAWRIKKIYISVFTFHQARPLQIQCMCVFAWRWAPLAANKSNSSTDACGCTVSKHRHDCHCAVCLIKNSHWSIHLIYNLFA